MSRNKVTFGLEKVHIAFVDETAQTQPAWDTPIPLPGAVRFSPEPLGDEVTFYADNGPYWTYTSNNGYDAELEMANIPDEVLTEMLGWEIDADGALVETTDGIPKEFALMGQVLGDKKNRRFVYYRCKASRPSKENSTRAESVEPNTDTLKIRILPIEVDMNGQKKNIVRRVMELNDTNQAAYDAFFNSVTLPTTAGGGA
jgi:phi13 family phage major tail protein